MNEEIFKKLKKAISWAVGSKYSSFYRKKYGKKNLAINKKEDFFKIPFLTRDAITNTHPKNRYFAPLSGANHIKYSGGSSGGDRVISYAKFDDSTSSFHEGFYKRYAHFFKVRCVLILVYAPSVFRDYIRFRKLFKKSVIVGSHLNLPDYAKMSRVLRVDAISTTPKRAVRFYPYLKKHHDPKKIKLLQFTGETANRLHSAYLRRNYVNAEFANAYAATESSIIAAQCVFLSKKQHNLYHMIRSRMFYEIRDRGTLKYSMPGELGELVISSLSANSFPLIRYRTGDLVRLVENSDAKCRCGSGMDNIEVFGSIKQSILKLGRYDFFRDHFEKKILPFCRYFTGNYWVKVSDENSKKSKSIVLKFEFETSKNIPLIVKKKIMDKILNAPLLLPSGFNIVEEKNAISLKLGVREGLLADPIVVYKNRIKLREKKYFIDNRQ